MRALVTGGAGFIGSTLVDRLLAEGHSVDVFDDLSTGSLANLAEARRAPRGAFSFHQVDLRAPEVVDLIVRRHPEVIFHLGAQASVGVSVDRPVFDAEVNVIGALRVLEGARLAPAKKIVYAASGGSLYGDVDPKNLPVAENGAHQPTSPYGVSKKAFIDYLNLYRDLHGIEFTALALANVYGPRQNAEGEAGVIAIFAENLVAGRPCVINGDGGQTRDFVYVDDVVDAFARAAQRGSGLVINVGGGIETSINELHALMAELVGRRASAKRRRARPGEVRHNALDSTRARIHLGWTPWTSLAEGIARTVEAVTAARHERSAP